ncbi:MAG: hypothetical protein HY855_09495 [Burkholderiales bacterium]|nr:hypothetical protein [Burkholderiales bacterium]
MRLSHLPRIAAVLGLLIGTLSAARADDAAPVLVSAVAVPYHAGMQRLAVPYGSGSIDTLVWYPTQATETPRALGPFIAQVALGARVLPGRFPLVVISHGTGGSNLNHHVQAEALARAGMIVAAPMHPGDNFRDRSLLATGAAYLSERPRQLGRVIEALLQDPQWQPRIDATRIGGLGHSAGGYSVAVLMGGQPDPARIGAHCREVQDDPACALRDPSAGVWAGPSVPATPMAFPVSDAPALPPGVTLRAALLTAPLVLPIAPGTLQAAAERIEVIGAEFDEVLPNRYHYEDLRRQLPASTPMRLAPGTSHMAFVSPVAPDWKDRAGPMSQDRPGFDRAAFQQQLATQTVAFFQRRLGGVSP